MAAADGVIPAEAGITAGDLAALAISAAEAGASLTKIVLASIPTLMDSKARVVVQYQGGPYHGRQKEETLPLGKVIFPAGSDWDLLFAYLEAGRLLLPCYILDPKTHIYFWRELPPVHQLENENP